MYKNPWSTLLIRNYTSILATSAAATCLPVLGAHAQSQTPAVAAGPAGSNIELQRFAPGLNRAGTFPEQIQTWEVRGLPADVAPPPEIKPQEEPIRKFRLRLGVDFPLRTSEGGFKGSGFQGSPAVSPTLQADIRYNPTSYWFAGVTFYRYLLEDRQRPWNPDFTYTFGFDDWHPGTISLVYGNYSGNRLLPDKGRLIEGQREERTRFSQGLWSVGYKILIPAAVKPLLVFDDKHEVGCSTNANYTPRYTDLKTRSTQAGKKSISLSCRYSTPSFWYANATFLYFPDRSQQQPWDPDFTYGFGYFNWRPGNITVQYNNYSGNRYPWHTRSPGQGSLRNGSISVSWSMAF